MKKIFLLIFLSILLVSCGSSKKSTSSRTKIHKTSSKKTAAKSNKKASERTNKSSGSKTVSNIIKTAKTFEGTKYKFGGTTKKGMDCSGLVYVAYGKEDVNLPRVSRDMAKQGKAVSLKKVTKGDLLFFKTGKSKNRVNHVGIVTNVKKGEVFFIHASTTRGVINSSLNESYWRKTFVEARRII
ncbi:MAG: C40 family peptidase [Flavobacteriaceae bacterium]|nr:C40 family peptidase [Flavobacteriaceae bacterium]